jgi:DNA-binding XRE family transcriptional regulator
MKLREVRARKLFSVRRLARTAQVAEKTIYAVEGGEWLPSLETVRKLSRALEVDPMEVDEFRAAIDKAASP